MKITVNPDEISRGNVKLITYDNTNNPSKLIFSTEAKKFAQEIYLAIINLLGLIGHYNQTFKSPISSVSNSNFDQF